MLNIPEKRGQPTGTTHSQQLTAATTAAFGEFGHRWKRIKPGPSFCLESKNFKISSHTHTKMYSQEQNNSKFENAKHSAHA